MHCAGSWHPKNMSVSTQPRVSYSRVRVIHNVANGPKVTVLADGQPLIGDVAYKAISDYLRVPSGRHTISVTTADGATTLIKNTTFDLKGNADYTIVAHGNVKDLSSLALLALGDDNACPAAGMAKIRFVHAAATIPAVDIYAGDAKIFDNVSYGATGISGKSAYLSVPTGMVSVSVTVAGDNKVQLGPLPLDLEEGKTYSVIASGLLDDAAAPLTALVSTDSSCSTIY